MTKFGYKYEWSFEQQHRQVPSTTSIRANSIWKNSYTQLVARCARGSRIFPSQYWVFRKHIETAVRRNISVRMSKFFSSIFFSTGRSMRAISTEEIGFKIALLNTCEVNVAIATRELDQLRYNLLIDRTGSKWIDYINALWKSLINVVES